MFPQTLIKAEFFISGIVPDILMNVWNIALDSLFWQSLFQLIFILSKNKGFQSGVLLKVHPSSPSIWSRFSEINKFKLSKDFIFTKITKAC